MHYRPDCLILLIVSAGCSTSGAAPRDPGSPTPVADPRSGPAAGAGGKSGAQGTESQGRSKVPLRPDQAPIVAVRDALAEDSLLGRRVRVEGRCVARGEGRRAGSWTLGQAGETIEVRGLVPPSCSRGEGEDLTIFAQIEAQTSGSRDRILLRLPD